MGRLHRVALPDDDPCREARLSVGERTEIITGQFISKSIVVGG